jgi:hypothetical protein
MQISQKQDNVTSNLTTTWKSLPEDLSVLILKMTKDQTVRMFGCVSSSCKREADMARNLALQDAKSFVSAHASHASVDALFECMMGRAISFNYSLVAWQGENQIQIFLCVLSHLIHFRIAFVGSELQETGPE